MYLSKSVHIELAVLVALSLLIWSVRSEENAVAFGDKTTGLKVFDSIEYLDRIVYIYAPMSNSGQEISSYQRFYYLPLMMPAYHENSSHNNWIRLIDRNRVKIELMQGNKKLKEVIKDSLAKRFGTSDTSNWVIMPLMIESITVYIKNGDSLVSGIQPVKLVHPDTYILSFQIQLQSKQLAQEFIKKILSEEYEIELSIRYTSFKKSLALYAFEHMQRAYSETIADEPVDQFKYILKSQTSQFAADLTSKIIETILLVDPSQSKDTTSLRSKFTILIANAISKLEQTSLDVGRYFEVWSGDEFEPDLLKNEINSLFKYSQEETEKRDDGRNYYFVDCIVSKAPNTTSIAYYEKHSDVRTGGDENKWKDSLCNQLHAKHQKVYSENEIEKFLNKNSIEGEWIGIKFTPSNFKVIDMDTVLESIKSRLISKRIYQEEVQGTIIKRVAIGSQGVPGMGNEEYSIIGGESSSFNNLSSTLLEKLNKIETSIDQLHKSIESGGGKSSHSTVQPDAIINTRSGWVRLAVIGNLSYLVSGNKQLQVYDLRTKELVRAFNGHTGDVYGVKSLVNKNKLISVAESEIKLWNVETGECEATEPTGSLILDIDVNNKHTLLAGGNSLNNIVLWDLSESLKPVRTFSGHVGPVNSLIFDNINDQLISGSQDSTIRVWSMNGEVKHTLTGHSGTINRLVLDEQTGLLYSGADDGKIKEWDIKSGECLRTLSGHTDQIRDLILSPDGTKLVSSSKDKKIIIWHKLSGRIIETLTYSTEFVSLAVNPLNGQLLSSTIDGRVQFWPYKPNYIEKDMALINQEVNILAKSEQRLSQQVSRILTLISNNRKPGDDNEGDDGSGFA